MLLFSHTPPLTPGENNHNRDVQAALIEDALAVGVLQGFASNVYSYFYSFPISIPFLFLFLFLQGASTRKPHCLLEILARLAQGEKMVLHVLEIWRALILHWLH